MTSSVNEVPKQKHNNHMKEAHSTFVNQFVNAVYGILLGYGFCNAMRDIKDAVQVGPYEKVGPIFSSLAVLFTIIVVCVYWWDWYKNIGKKVESSVQEFTIDMAILVSLEVLFFVYEYPILYGSVFFLLSLLSLLWVVNYHFVLRKRLSYASFSEYIRSNPDVKKYFMVRILGVAIYGACLIIIVDLHFYNPYHLIKIGLWKGYWLELLCIVITYIIYRKFIFGMGGKRPGIDQDVREKNGVLNLK